MTPTTPSASTPGPTRLAVIGAGPAGLALALLAAQRWPQACVSVFDARPADRDVAGDPRTLALSLGSVQLLQQLAVWPETQAQPILAVHVSQAPPTLAVEGLRPAVWLRAAEAGVAQLGAVLTYGQLVAPLQAAWQARCAAQPNRCQLRLGTPVRGLKSVAGGVEVDADIAERFDLAVVAEGGVFADQARKAIARDYQQTAWVGSVQLDAGATAAPAGTAFERFTRDGPVALLPLPAQAGDAPGLRRAALVWCVNRDDDPVAGLNDTQRRQVLAHLLPAEAGRLLTLGPLKSFALGLNAERSLVQGRQVRIGNAAQTLHPVAGQGLNLGKGDDDAQTGPAQEEITQLIQSLQNARLSDNPVREDSQPVKPLRISDSVADPVVLQPAAAPGDVKKATPTAAKRKPH